MQNVKINKKTCFNWNKIWDKYVNFKKDIQLHFIFNKNNA